MLWSNASFVMVVSNVYLYYYNTRKFLSNKSISNFVIWQTTTTKMRYNNFFKENFFHVLKTLLKNKLPPWRKMPMVVKRLVVYKLLVVLCMTKICDLLCICVTMQQYKMKQNLHKKTMFVLCSYLFMKMFLFLCQRNCHQSSSQIYY